MSVKFEIRLSTLILACLVGFIAGLGLSTLAALDHYWWLLMGWFISLAFWYIRRLYLKTFAIDLEISWLEIIVYALSFIYIAYLINKPL